MVVGQFMSRACKLKVEFSTQLGVEYGFGKWDLPKKGTQTLSTIYNREMLAVVICWMPISYTEHRTELSCAQKAR